MAGPDDIGSDATVLVAPTADGVAPATGEPAATSTPPGAATADLPPLTRERVAGRFEIVALLGKGGMGHVYKARDLELGELVALKLISHDAAASPEQLERFRQEVRLARRVTHPNVARTYDIGEHQGEKFLTMEFIDGEPLTARLAREGVLDLAEVVALTVPLCAGLGAAHAAGVVHRDLKPDNVLIDRSGRVVITDFGIARAAAGTADPSAQHTRGLPVGTPHYMAPEQLEAKPVDARTDLYALGVMLFEMLTGQKPFTGTSPMAIAVARLMRPPPDPRTLRPNLPAPVAELILRCLAQQPERRPASAAEVSRVLQAQLVAVQAGRVASAPASHAIPSAAAPGAATAPTVALPGGSAASATAPTVTLAGGSAPPATAPPATAPPATAPPATAPPATAPPATAPPATAPTVALAGGSAPPAGLRAGGSGPLPAGTSGVEGSGTRPGEITLAVLPFRNAGAPEEAHWADGFTDDLLESLSLIDRLRVRSRGSVLPFAGSARDPREIGRDLGVQVIVEGSVRRRPGTVRVAVRLVSVADGFQIWAQRFDRPDGDLLAVVDEAAQAIAEGLLREYAPADRGRPPLSHPMALDLYLKARHNLRIYSPDSAAVAVGLLERALGFAPDEPRLLAFLALACARSWVFDRESQSDVLHERARALASRARELAPELGEPHLAVAALCNQQLQMVACATELRQVLAKAPLLGEAYELLAATQVELGQLDAALRSVDRALAMEPTLSLSRLIKSRALALKGDWDGAMEMVAGNEVIEVISRSRYLTWRGRPDESEALLRAATPSFFVTGMLRHAHEGRWRESIPATSLRRRTRAFFAQLHLEVCAARGDVETALGLLEEIDGEGIIDVGWLDRCPVLDGLRSLPRFQAVAQRVRARAQAVIDALGTPG